MDQCYYVFEVLGYEQLLFLCKFVLLGYNNSLEKMSQGSWKVRDKF